VAPPLRPGAGRRARLARPIVLGALLALSAALAVPLAAILQGPRAVTSLAQEWLFLGAPSAFAVAVLGALLVADVLLPRRLFCRALCPAGSIAKLVRAPKALRVSFDARRCDCAGAGACTACCPWGEDPRALDRLDGCTRCGACVEACPSGALAFRLRERR
jgi:polyferredoxin